MSSAPVSSPPVVAPDGPVPGAGAAPSTPVLAARWALSHGLLRTVVASRARGGSADARLLRDPAWQAEPWAHYRLLRECRPFAAGPTGRITAHHDVVTQVLRSDDFGVADRDRVLPAPARAAMRLVGPRRYAGVDAPPSMLAVDPPDHARFRRLVTRAFTAKAVAALRTRTEEIAAELLDELADAFGHEGPVDLVRRYAALVPVTVIAEMLGVPPEMRRTLLAWGDGAAASLDMGMPWPSYARSERSLAAFDAWLRGHLRGLREAPGQDLLSTLVQVADDDGSGLTEQELVATSMLILAAGFETTVNLISNGTVRLFENPDQRALLTEDPSLWPNAVDEVLRHDSPVQRTARMARRDTEVEGVPVAQGEIVVTVLGAANRDPAVFPDPDRFDVTRANAKDHVAFSSGIHYCLGAALARMEGEVALRALFTRFPDLAPAGEAVRRPTVILRGWETLPVRG
jgi:cytochrome P450